MHPAYFIFRFTINHDQHFFMYIYTYLSGYSLQHLANMSILALSSGWTETFPCSHLSSFQLVCLGPPSILLFVQRFIFHTYNHPLTIRRFNTFIQVHIMGARYNIYNRHIHKLQLFFLCFCLTSGQASWPQTFMSGTVTRFAK
jgi:hypothetical protein